MLIRAARFPDDLDEVKALFLEYADSLGVDLSFQDFAREVETLPGEYVPPRGAMLLAIDEDRIIGCVALRPIDAEACEMKRLYLRPTARGKGAGLALARAILAEATRIGYACLRLDTLPMMGDAMRLYERLGFVDIAPYRFNPIPGSRFMEKRLQS